MKRYSMSAAAAHAHVPANPERTARKDGPGLDFDVYFQVWPSREAMLKTIQTQGASAPHPSHWRACKVAA